MTDDNGQNDTLNVATDGTKDDATQSVDGRGHRWAAHENDRLMGLLFDTVLQHQQVQDHVHSAIHHIHKHHNIMPSLYRLILAHMADQITDDMSHNGSLHALVDNDEFWSFKTSD